MLRIQNFLNPIVIYTAFTISVSVVAITGTHKSGLGLEPVIIAIVLDLVDVLFLVTSQNVTFSSSKEHLNARLN